MPTPEIKSPFTNLQLELLKLFAQDIKEEDLLAIRQIIAAYFANKAMDLADNVWDRDNWTDEKIHQLAHSKLRGSSTEYLHESSH